MQKKKKIRNQRRRIKGQRRRPGVWQGDARSLITPLIVRKSSIRKNCGGQGRAARCVASHRLLVVPALVYKGEPVNEKVGNKMAQPQKKKKKKKKKKKQKKKKKKKERKKKKKKKEKKNKKKKKKKR